MVGSIQKYLYQPMIFINTIDQLTIAICNNRPNSNRYIHTWQIIKKNLLNYWKFGNAENWKYEFIAK